MIDFVTSEVKPAGMLSPKGAALPLALISPSACLANSNSSSCGLNGILHLLYVLAAILAVLLLGAVIAAVYIWRRNRRAESPR